MALCAELPGVRGPAQIVCGLPIGGPDCQQTEARGKYPCPAMRFRDDAHAIFVASNNLPEEILLSDVKVSRLRHLGRLQAIVDQLNPVPHPCGGGTLQVRLTADIGRDDSAG